MKETPVYLFTGFLEGGKTKFINETIDQGSFDDGENTLLLVCEEGVEEYDAEALAQKNIFVEILDSKSKFNPDKLAALQKKHKAGRVICEYNGMWLISDLFEAMPDGWVIPQIMMFCDSETFMDYNANMRSLVVDKLNNTDLVVFNRFEPDADKMPYHTIVRGISRMCDIAYEYPNGDAEYDDIEDPLPFDIDASVIEVSDKDFAIWYRDVSEELDKYDGKTVKIRGLVAINPQIPKNCFVFGREIMTCCVDDIKYAGMIVEGGENFSVKHGDWIILTAKINIKHNKIYGKKGPVLYALNVESTNAPEDPVATFY